MNRQKEIYRATLAGSLVNFLLLLFKFAAGLLGHSSAMIADAFHSLSDFASDIIVLCFVRLAGRPEDEDHAYGHGKYETLASIIIGLILAAVGLGLLADGIARVAGFLAGQKPPSPNWWALSAAIVSLACKEALYRYTTSIAKKIDSPVLEANAWHHRSDALTSIAALLGIGGAMALGPDWNVLDPLACLVVCAFILKAAWDLLRPGFQEFMEKSLPEEERKSIALIILSTPGVVDFHRLRTRRIGPGRAVEAHIKMNGEISLNEAHDIASLLEKRLKEELGENIHVGIHMEPVRARAESPEPRAL